MYTKKCLTLLLSGSDASQQPHATQWVSRQFYCLMLPSHPVNQTQVYAMMCSLCSAVNSGNSDNSVVLSSDVVNSPCESDSSLWNNV